MPERSGGKLTKVPVARSDPQARKTWAAARLEPAEPQLAKGSWWKHGGSCHEDDAANGKTCDSLRGTSTPRAAPLPEAPLTKQNNAEGCGDGLAHGLRSKEDEYRFTCEICSLPEISLVADN